MTHANRGQEGRVVVVTGGATGIGATYSRAFAEAGARVVIGDVATDAGEDLVSALSDHGHSAIFVTTDVTSDDSLSELAEVIRRDLGGLDALVNNAAVFRG